MVHSTYSSFFPILIYIDKKKQKTIQLKAYILERRVSKSTKHLQATHHSNGWRISESVVHFS